MKTKIKRKPFQAKLSHLISAYIKSATDADSKKITKSIRKASRIIAKAVAKEIKKSKTLNPFWEKPVAEKRKIKKITKAKVIKKSPPKVVHKIKKTSPVKVVQKTEEIPVATHVEKIEQEIISEQ